LAAPGIGGKAGNGGNGSNAPPPPPPLGASLLLVLLLVALVLDDLPGAPIPSLSLSSVSFYVSFSILSV